MHTLKTYFAIYRVNLHDALAYKGQLLYWCGLTVLSFVISYFLWTTVFLGQAVVGGYQKVELLSYYVMVAFIEGLVVVWLEPGMEDQVREGRFTAWLTRPMSFPLFQLLSTLAWKTVWMSVLVPVYTVLIWIIGDQVHLAPVASRLPYVALTLVASFLTYFLLSFLISLSAFWLLKIYSVIDILRYSLLPFLSGMLVPTTLFPPIAQSILHYTPFPYLLTVPVELYLGRPQPIAFWSGFGIQVIWIGLLIIIVRWVWYRALRQYEAVGA